MISYRISDDIPPQMKILDMVIPIPAVSFKLECCKQHKAAGHQMKFDAFNDIKIFPTV